MNLCYGFLKLYIINIKVFFAQFGSTTINFSIVDFFSCLLSNKDGSASLKGTEKPRNSQEPNIADSTQYEKRNQKKQFKYGKKHPNNNGNLASHKRPQNQNARME